MRAMVVIDVKAIIINLHTIIPHHLLSLMDLFAQCAILQHWLYPIIIISSIHALDVNFLHVRLL
jgi:hypothetical protein